MRKYFPMTSFPKKEIKGIEMHNQQLSLKRYSNEYYNQNKALESMNINKSLSKYIYEFLIGKTNELPNIDFFKKVFMISKNKIISMGYGITINKDFEIVYTSPIDDSDIERIDIINLNGYMAFKENPGFKEENYTETRNEFNRMVDVNKNPIFDIKRVNYIRQYLKKCQEYILSFENEKNL